MPPNKEEEQQKEMQEFIVSEVKSIYTSKKNGYSLISCHASIPRLYNLSPPSSGE